ncbi:MAG TPA: hypothetical protein VM186_05440 [Planctomycetota bacterium]|nr:hypothetical protein [Planctomycetota bacterium]
MNILDQLHVVPGLYPVADFMAGGVSTDIVRCQSAVGVRFLIFRGNATGGTATGVVTVSACDTVGPGTATAVEFQYRISTTPDIWGAWTQALAAGFTMTAGDNQIYDVFVPAANCAALGFGYCRLNITEPVNDPQDGCVLIEVVQPRYQPVPATLLT